MKPTLKLLIALFLVFFIKNEMWAGNTCNTATPIANNMSLFETHSNLATNNSGVDAPPCGNYNSNDFWLSTTVPPTGFLSVVVLAGTMTDPAIAIYSGSCANLTLEGCSSEDFCGDASSAIFEGSGLPVGATYYIRVWAVNGAPNGTFDIRVSQSNPPSTIPTDIDATVGSATQNGECIQLTTEGNNQLGCAWNSTQDDLSQILEKAVTLNFGTKDANGADGITIGFQDAPQGTNACGIGGGGIGANGIQNSFLIEFDTWNNGTGAGADDIPQDHVAIFVNGDIANPINGPVALNGGNIEDGLDHTVRFKWNGTTNDYEVYFDEVLVLSGNYDISANCLNGGSMAHWGATASTGGSNNNQSICPYEPEPFSAGVEQSVDVTICDGESYFAGGANQTTTGVYQDNTILPNGCQSVITTNLTVIPSSTSSMSEVLCTGNCITVGTSTYCTTGTFTTTLQNANSLGCDSIVTLNLTILDPSAIIVTNPPPTIDCSSPTITLDGSFSQGNGVTFQWGGPCILSGETTPFPVVACAGTYTLVVTQSSGAIVCTDIATVTVIGDGVVPTAEAGNNQTLDCSTGCTTLSSLGSTTGASIIYSWSGPNGFNSTNPNPQVCEAGTYLLTVFNSANNCVASDNVVVTGSATTVADAGNDMSIDCNNLTTTLDGSNSDNGAGFNLVWLDANGMQVGTGTNFNTGDIGTYTLVVTNTTTGCSSTDDVDVTGSITPPTANAGDDMSISCASNSVTLNGSNSDNGSGFNLVWQDANGTPVGIGTTFTTNMSGTYTLVVTNTATGCSSSDDVIVDGDNTPPTVDAGSDMIIDCNTMMVTLNGSNSNMGTGFDLIWLNANGIPIGVGATLSTGDGGTYTLVVTNTATGCSASDDATVFLNNTPPTANAGDDMSISCSAGSVTLDGSNSDTGAAFNLVWQDANGMQVGTGATYNTSMAGTYTLVVTNIATGCSTSDDVVVSGNSDLPTANAGDDMAISCSASTVTLDGSNSDNGTGFDLVWQDANGMQVGMGTTFSTSMVGTYTLVVTNTANGCSTSDDVIVSGNSDLPTANAGDDMAISCSASTVTLDGSNSDNGTGFDLVWQDANGMQVGMGTTFSTSMAGTYTLVVTNTANGCSTSDDVIVSGNSDVPTANAGDDMAISCSTGSVTLDGSNSDNGSGFDLVWQDANGMQVGMGTSFSTSMAGTYTLVVTNTANGCSTSDDVIVSGNNDMPIANAGDDMTISCSAGSVTLDGSNSDNGTGFDLVWQDANGMQVGMGTTFSTSMAGTYTLVVTNTANGCSTSDDVVVSGNSDMPIANAGDDMAISCSAGSVTLDGSNSDNGTGFDLVWQDANGMQVGMGTTFSTSMAGTYTLVVTNTTNGCSASDDVIVSGTSALPTSDAGLNATLTCSILDITLNGSNSSSGGNFTYQWQNSAMDSIGNDIIQTITTPDTYTLIVTDNTNGCTATSTVTIDEDVTPPTAEAGTGGMLSCAASSIILDGSNSSTGGNFSYEWFNSNNTNVGSGTTTSVASADTYFILVTNMDNGCSAVDSVIIQQDTDVPTVNATSNGDITCTNMQVTLDATGSSTGMDITYEWFDDQNTSLGNDLMISTSDSGTYTLVVTNIASTCSSSINVVVNENMTAPSISIATPDTINCSVNEVTLDASSSSSTSNFTYQWLDPNLDLVGTDLITNVSNAGSYTLVITDTINGCTSAESIQVAQDGDIPIANISIPTDMLSCDVENILLQTSGSSTGNDIEYTWMNGATPLGDSLTLNVTTPGQYTLTISNTANGCSTMTAVDISQDIIAPQISTSGGTLTCLQDEVTLDGTGSSDSSIIAYEWQDDLGAFLSDDITYDVNQTGVYNFIVTNTSNGCTSTESITIDENITNVISDAGLNSTLTCGTDSIQLDGNNSTSGMSINYQWTNSVGVLLGNDPIQFINTADTFFLIVTDTNNGCADTSFVAVDQDVNLPTPNISASGMLTCSDMSVTLDGTGSSGVGTLTYSWSDPNNVFISNDNNIAVTSIGNYELIVTDMSNGCSSTTTFLVENNMDAPFADAGMNDTLSCTNNMGILNGTNSDLGANFSYQWISPNGTTAGFAPILNTTESGTFTLVVTNTTNGCSSTSSAQIVQTASQPSAVILPPDQITCNQSSILLIGSQSSGVGTLNYQWYNSIGQPIGNDPNLNISQSGTYILDIIDISNNCVASTSVQVDADITPPTASTNLAGTLNCNQDTYIIDATNSTTGSSITYEWQNSNGVTVSNNFSYETSVTGTYNLIVSNSANGCSSEITTEVMEDFATPTPLPLLDGILTCDNLDVELNGNSSIGSNGSALSFEWFDPSGNSISTNDILTVADIGLYQLVVTNATNGCSAEQDILVEEDVTQPQPSIDALTNLNLSCNQMSLVVDASNSTPIGNVTYEWTQNNIVISTDPNPQIDEAGELFLTVTDTQNGCSATTSVIIDENINPPNITITDADDLTCTITSVQLNATGSTGSDFEYLWIGPGTIINETTLNPTVDATGIYTLTITNITNGCEAIEMVTVSENVTPPVVSIAPANDFDCNTSSIALDGSGSSSGNFTYQWTTTNGNISGTTNTVNTTVSLPGIYSLEITNTDNGCTAIQSITVNESTDVISSAEIIVIDPPCFGDAGSIFVQDVDGGTPPYLYSLDFQPLTNVSAYTGLDAGTYTLTIEDATGCTFVEEINIAPAIELLAELPPSVTIRLGEEYELQPQINFPIADLEIAWTLADSLSCTDCPFPIANPTYSTFYEITVINANGCKTVEGMWVIVEKPRDVFIPNTFTPNDDGNNDIFYIFADETSVKQVNKFQIFTRWGEVVFSDENFQPNLAQHGWDGFFKGEKINPSVLVYYAEIEFVDGFVEVYKGDVTLQ